MLTVKTLLESGPRYMGGVQFKGLHWTPSDGEALRVLCEGNVPPETSGDILGRTAKSIANRARDTGLALPASWRALVIPKRKPREISVPLQYPYIIKARGDHADLLAVNALVPHGLPTHMRADVCQEIMLALWQGAVKLDDLRRNKALVSRFIGGFRKANFENGGYGVMSIDQPRADGRSWHDLLPA